MTDAEMQAQIEDMLEMHRTLAVDDPVELAIGDVVMFDPVAGYTVRYEVWLAVVESRYRADTGWVEYPRPRLEAGSRMRCYRGNPLGVTANELRSDVSGEPSVGELREHCFSSVTGAVCLDLGPASEGLLDRSEPLADVWLEPASAPLMSSATADEVSVAQHRVDEMLVMHLPELTDEIVADELAAGGKRRAAGMAGLGELTAGLEPVNALRYLCDEMRALLRGTEHAMLMPAIRTIGRI